MASTKEEVILPSSNNSHSDLNGDMSGNSDMVSSVHNNIFFKAFGRPSKHYTTHRFEGDNKRNGSESDVLVDDEVVEYHPGSGFVTRLLGKFTNLSTKEDNVTPRVKRSSSLERDGVFEKDTSKKPFTLQEVSRTEYDKPGPFMPKLTQKAGSIDGLNHTTTTTTTTHKLRQTFPVSLRHIDKRDSTEKQPKSPRESLNIIAPDTDLARDDIVIIENPPPVPPLALDESDTDKEDSSPPISSYRDDVPIEELPKPNTVINVRSIFETASVGSTNSVSHGRKQKSDSFSDVKNDSTSNNKEKAQNEFPSSNSPPVMSPRILSYDSPPPSWLSKRNSSEYSTATNTSSSTVKPDVTATNSNYSKFSSHDNRPRSISEMPSRSPKEIKSHSSSIFDSGNLLDHNGKMSDSSRATPSPRSTASVKPTISNQPATVVKIKPIPISTPPSAATSYKKSPVVPVAPFKSQEGKVDDGSPVMIYEKPKSPSRKVRPDRNKRYDDIPSKNGNDMKGTAESKDSLIMNNERKSKVFEKDIETNKRKSDKPATPYDMTDARTVENNIANNREKTFSFIKPTVNDEGKNVSQPYSNKDTSSVSMGKDKTTISIGSSKTQTSVSNNQDSALQTKKYKAPSPVPHKSNAPNLEKTSSKWSRAPEPPATKSTKEEKPQSMIYLSSSNSETSESDSSPPETPRTEPVKVSDRVKITEPVKLPERVKITEPVKIPEPVKVPERVKITQPVKLPERVKITEPVKLPERVKITEPARVQEPTKLPDRSRISEPIKTNDRVKDREDFKVPPPENNDTPIKGIPSIIARRLNKQSNSSRELSNSIIADNNDSDSDASPYRNAAAADKPIFPSKDMESIRNAENAKQQDSISSEIENEIAAVRKKMDSNRNKSSGPAQIFDSSQLAKKREENKRQKAAAAAAAQGIPRLDFSSLNEDKSQRMMMMQKEIKPCNIKFIGENAKTSRNLLKKQRKVKTNIQFKESICETFEYPNEEQALEIYLYDHPNEPRELKEEEPTTSLVFLDGLSETDGMGESSDDADIIFADAEPPEESPRLKDKEEENLKSNPALSSTNSTLQSYRGRFQEEFIFGSNMSEPDTPPPLPLLDPVDSDSMMLRPSEEESSNIWSTNNSSDLLF